MASTLIKKAILSNPKALRNSIGIFCNATRNHWNYQYKPGPYPKTPEERAAAAKKYGLPVEVYQPYPEDMCYGDYPKLPDIGTDSKDPYYPYDYPEHRRNFNEPIHVTQEIIGEDRYDISMRPILPVWQQWTWFLGTVGAFLVSFFILEDYKFGRPVAIKQYPNEGPHYYFTPK